MYLCLFVFQMLLDQTDFLVVGVLGLQGSGKSTIMSMLAGNTDEDVPRYNFQLQVHMKRLSGQVFSSPDVKS